MEETLSEEEKRALRGSKFAPLPAPPPPSVRPQPRLAHPGGPMATNKAAALAKFLERKLHQPGGLESIDPRVLEVAVKNAKETVIASHGGASSSGRIVRHVASFGDSSEESDDAQPKMEEPKLKNKPKKKKKEKKEKKKKKKITQIRKYQKTVKMKKSKS